MVNSFSIGDYVGILDGTEKGIIVKIEKNKAWIETENGFEITSPLTKLVRYKKKKKPTSFVPSIIKMPEDKKSSDEFPSEKKPIIKKVKDYTFKVNPSLLGEETPKYRGKSKDSFWEVDLHIEEIVDQYNHLTNGEIVDIQLSYTKSIIEKARRNKIQKLIFIHGKGKGILRLALLHLLSGYTFLEYYDASFKDYGGGAIEVKVFVSRV